MEIKEVSYSDEYIAAIWLYNLITERRREIIHQVKNSDGALVDKALLYYFVSKAVYDSFKLCYKKYNKNHHDKIMDKFYLMVLNGDIKPEDAGLQSFSLKVLVTYLREKKSINFLELNKKIKHDCQCLERIGYTVPFERMREFYLKILTEALTQILVNEKVRL